MRIIFMGTPDFAVPTLDALVDAGHDLCAVYTQPPRKAGRGKQLRRGRVHLRAEELGLAVRHPPTLKPAEARADFAALQADIAVVAAYGLLLPKEILAAPPRGCINVHGSLLPRWRGAAPIQRAILAGDEQTGITIMQMERGLDTGPMISQAATPIGDKTSGDLHAELASMGAKLLIDVLALPSMPGAQPQDSSLATHAPKIDKAETRLDFSRSAQQLERAVRAFSPVPGAWCEIGGERVKVLRADVVDMAGEAGCILDENLTIACGQHALRPSLLQRAGKPAMARDAYLRGRPATPGTSVL